MKDPKEIYKGKKVLILGLGLNQGGVGSAKFFAEALAKVKVTDLKNKDDLNLSLQELKEYEGITYTLGEHKFEDVDWADIIIRNPAVKPDNPYILHALSKGKVVEMDMGIFLNFIKPEQIIGITGTKGKSTTSSLIYEILKAESPERATASRRIVFAGNIGKSVLDTIKHVKDDTLVVLELSSFQLEAFEQHKVSPHFAVITNILPDHLNYYQTMENYIAAKRVIAKYQSLEDYLFIKKGDDITNDPDFLKDLDTQIIYFSPSDLPANFKPKLPGDYNLDNFAAAFVLAKKFNIDEKLALDVMQNFEGVEYRLQLIKTINGIKIYNDSTATMPSSTIQALKAIPGSILIAGGMNKNLGYHDMALAMDDHAKAVYFLEGDATDELKILIKEQDKIMGTYTDLEELLQDIKETAKPDDVILFSPGATSFNLFQNEFDRARKFNLAVDKVFTK